MYSKDDIKHIYYTDTVRCKDYKPIWSYSDVALFDFCIKEDIPFLAVFFINKKISKALLYRQLYYYSLGIKFKDGFKSGFFAF